MDVLIVLLYFNTGAGNGRQTQKQVSQFFPGFPRGRMARMAQIAAVIFGTFFVFALGQEISDEAKKDGPLAFTSLGYVRGTEGETEQGTRFAKYTKIPFAEPPIGELRLRDPRSKKAWSGELDGTQVAPPCLQVEYLEESAPRRSREDCLYLNVFTPNVLNNDQTSLKPVMVWIHGGGFTEGDASTLIDPEYLLDQDVVFVSIQYRLGLLGFLAVENSTDLTGNLGLKDQQEALRWVQRNIVFFGGDPAKVTIFGVSAGAVSVHSQVLSPSAKGLFRAAILQSGTALFYYERIVHRTTEKKGSEVVEKLGCANADDQLECLRLLDAEAFSDPELDAQVWPVQVTTDSTGMRNGKE